MAATGSRIAKQPPVMLEKRRENDVIAKKKRKGKEKQKKNDNHWPSSSGPFGGFDRNSGPSGIFHERKPMKQPNLT